MSFPLVWINLFIWFRLRSSSHYEEWINRQVILTATSNTDLFHLKIACKRIFLTPRCEETIKAFLTVATVIANIVLLVISFLSSQTLSCHVISILGLITNIVLVRPLVEDAVQGGLEHSGLPPRRHQCQELEGRAPAGLNDFSKDRQPELSFLVWCSTAVPSPIQSKKWHFERPCIAKDRLQPPSEQDNGGEEELTTSTSPPKATKEKPDSAEVRFQHYDNCHMQRRALNILRIANAVMSGRTW